jgi:hypothetical protein
LIVKITGGLGNQAFLWAFGVSVSLARNLPLAFHLGEDLGPSGYRLDRYDIDVPLVEESGPIYYEQGMQFNPGVYDAPADCMYVGYFQSSKYFHKPELIRSKLQKPRSLSPEAMAMAERIAKTNNSVSIHVRRGDNLHPASQENHGDLAQTDYYDKAIQYVRDRVPDPTFFIFSDEAEWCEQNFRPNPSIVVLHQQPEEDIYLISKCRHGVTANSTFSWWGNWLNPNTDRIVIAPKRWFVTPLRDSRDICPDRWVLI